MNKVQMFHTNVSAKCLCEGIVQTETTYATLTNLMVRDGV